MEIDIHKTVPQMGLEIPSLLCFPLRRGIYRRSLHRPTLPGENNHAAECFPPIRYAYGRVGEIIAGAQKCQVVIADLWGPGGGVSRLVPVS